MPGAGWVGASWTLGFLRPAEVSGNVELLGQDSNLQPSG
jgi:hypothetical protein